MARGVFVEVVENKFEGLVKAKDLPGDFGCITFFQANQLSQIIRDYIYFPAGLFQSDIFLEKKMKF